MKKAVVLFSMIFAVILLISFEKLSEIRENRDISTPCVFIKYYFTQLLYH